MKYLTPFLLSLIIPLSACSTGVTVGNGIVTIDNDLMNATRAQKMDVEVKTPDGTEIKYSAVTAGQDNDNVPIAGITTQGLIELDKGLSQRHAMDSRGMMYLEGEKTKRVLGTQKPTLYNPEVAKPVFNPIISKP